MAERVTIVVPGDDPQQITGSPNLARLAPYGDVVLFDTRPANRQEQIERVKDAEIIINSRGAVTWREAELRALPKLRMIATCSIGTDMIDLEVAKELGVVVSNQPGRTAPAVAEHMFALMFAVAKRAAFQTAELRAGRWTRKINATIQGKTLGIVGTGAIGAEMARMGRALGMEVIAWTFNPSEARAERLGLRYVALDELLAAGINDFGGISPVTPDYINPGHAWPHILGLRERCAHAGFSLAPRLPIYEPWIDRPGFVARQISDAIAITGARLDGFSRSRVGAR